jgi:hypothetical protein
MLPGEREVNRCCRLLRLVVAVHLWRPRPQGFTVLVLSASGYGLALDCDSAESTDVVIVREREYVGSMSLVPTKVMSMEMVKIYLNIEAHVLHKSCCTCVVSEVGSLS